MDCGTDESDEDMWVPFWGVYGLFLLDGYAPNNDLLARVGCGQIHNEGAWSNRLPWAFWFLLSPWDEANLLAGGGAPPVISNTTLTASGMVFAVRTLGGWTYRVESRTNLVGSGWVPATNRFRETLPWSVRTFGETNTAGLRRFFRIVATNAW
jgi:hypothetical protein